MNQIIADLLTELGDHAVLSGELDGAVLLQLLAERGYTVVKAEPVASERATGAPAQSEPSTGRRVHKS